MIPATVQPSLQMPLIAAPPAVRPREATTSEGGDAAATPETVRSVSQSPKMDGHEPSTEMSEDGVKSFMGAYNRTGSVGEFSRPGSLFSARA